MSPPQILKHLISSVVSLAQLVSPSVALPDELVIIIISLNSSHFEKKSSVLFSSNEFGKNLSGRVSNSDGKGLYNSSVWLQYFLIL